VNPLSALLGVGVEVRNRLYDRGTLQTRRLRAPVVSVGSISAGGAGKTPFLIMLGGLLKQRGVAFDVLSRGYGRRTTGVAVVDPAASPRAFGDEPLLIARKLGVPVVVGGDRFAAGSLAEEKFGPRLHLLDDGFQHRALAREFDIVLIAGRDLHDSLLPVGRLREPLSSLARASAVVAMDDAAVGHIPLRPGQLVWRVLRGITVAPTGAACFAFCGIARPENFYAELRRAGIRLAGTRAFRDHHAYSEADARALLKQRTESGAEALITTEKDAVNLGELMALLQPIHIVTVGMQFEPVGLADAESPIGQICAAIGPWNQRPVRK